MYYLNETCKNTETEKLSKWGSQKMKNSKYVRLFPDIFKEVQKLWIIVLKVVRRVNGTLVKVTKIRINKRESP